MIDDINNILYFFRKGIQNIHSFFIMCYSNNNVSVEKTYNIESVDHKQTKIARNIKFHGMFFLCSRNTVSSNVPTFSSGDIRR